LFKHKNTSKKDTFRSRLHE